MSPEEKEAHKAKRKAAWEQKKANASPEKLQKMLAREKIRDQKRKERETKKAAFEKMTDEEKAAYKAKKKADRIARRKDIWEQKKANASPE